MQIVRTPQVNAKTGGLAYSIASTCLLFVSLLVSVIITLSSLKGEDDAFVYLSYLASPVGIAIASALVLKFRSVPFGTAFPLLPKNPSRAEWKYYLIGFMMTVGLLFSLSWINTGFTELLKLCGYTPRKDYLPNLSGGLIVPALIVVAVIPAIAEEALFRGLILNTSVRELGTVRTVFIVGFLFSLYHGNVEQTAYQFICGCAFAFLAMRSQSVLPSVSAHFLNNALIIIFSAVGLIDSAGVFAAPLWLNIVLGVLGGLAFIGGVVWLCFDKGEVYGCRKGALKDFFLFASVGIGLQAVQWILSLFPAGTII